MATASGDTTVILWDLETKQPRITLKGHTDSVQCVAFSDSGNLLASASRDKTVRLWNAKTGEPSGELTGHTGSANVVAFSKDGKYLASGSDDERIIVWDLETRTSIAEHASEGLVWSVAFTPDNSIVFTGTSKKIERWNFKDESPSELLLMTRANVSSLTFSPNYELLSATCADGNVKLLNYEEGTLRGTLAAHATDAMCSDFSPDGKSLVTCGGDGRIRFWYLNLLEPTLHIDVPGVWIQNVRFSPDGSSIAAGSWDNKVRLWSPE